MTVLSMEEITEMIRILLQKYSAESALLFGSYARGEATPSSDIDIILVGGEHFVPHNIFAFAEELRALSGRNADVFEIREINNGSSLYKTVMKEGIRIA